MEFGQRETLSTPIGKVTFLFVELPPQEAFAAVPSRHRAISNREAEQLLASNPQHWPDFPRKVHTSTWVAFEAPGKPFAKQLQIKDHAAADPRTYKLSATIPKVFVGKRNVALYYEHGDFEMDWSTGRFRGEPRGSFRLPTQTDWKRNTDWRVVDPETGLLGAKVANSRDPAARWFPRADAPGLGPIERDSSAPHRLSLSRLYNRIAVAWIKA